jgi:hypothetical protein
MAMLPTSLLPSSPFGERFNMNRKISNMRFLKYKIYGLAFLTLLAAGACTKQYKNYDNFINGGPIVYPGRADSVQALSGNERILLKWAVPSDGNITRYKIFWNFNGDSLDVPGRKPVTGDSVKIYINSLPEGAYNFTVYSYDGKGHRSVGTNAIGNVYGSIFSSTIFTRPIRGLQRDTAGATLNVGWVGLDERCIGTEWMYTNKNGAAASFFSPLDDSTIITSIDVTKPISYQSLFLPEPNAIDTFFTEFKTL